MDLLRLLAETIGRTIELGREALRLDPDINAVLTQPYGWLSPLLLACVAAVSLVVGQSVVLFANRIRRWALAFSLIFSIGATLVAYAFEGLLLWGLSFAVAPESLSLQEVTVVVLVSSAPQTLSFLGAIPLLGPGINRLLSVWQLLVLWVLVDRAFGVGIWTAAGMAMTAWLGVLLLSTVSSPSIARLRDWIWRKATGRLLHPDTDFVLAIAPSRSEP